MQQTPNPFAHMPEFEPPVIVDKEKNRGVFFLYHIMIILSVHAKGLQSYFFSMSQSFFLKRKTRRAF